jgi:hypothetical protein
MSNTQGDENMNNKRIDFNESGRKEETGPCTFVTQDKLSPVYLNNNA